MVSTRFSFDVCRAYINSQLQRAEASPRSRTRLPVVTISRQTGAGGVTLGEKLAEYLQAHDTKKECPWTLFDKELVRKVLEDHQLSEDMARFMPEDRYPSVQDTIESLLGLHPQHEALVEKTTRTILNLAEMGDAIIVGRGANVVVGFVPHAFHVRLVGSLEHRARRAEAYYHVSGPEAREFIRRTDEGRKRYLRHNFNKDIDNPLLYHVVLNTDHFGVEEAAALIGRTVLERARSG